MLSANLQTCIATVSLSGGLAEKLEAIAAARKRGNRIVTGLGMLLHQGVPAWKAWFGIEPKVTAELRARIEATL